MRTIEEPMCHNRKCKHFIGVRKPKGSMEEGEYLVCRAFPNGIPEEVSHGNNKHTKPIKGDHGIQFEPIEK